MTNWLPNLEAPAASHAIAIADALARDIAGGRLKPGDRLPTHRDLSWRLGVSVGTVTRAYAEAERRGDITGEVGRGTFVRGRIPDTLPVVSQRDVADGLIDLSHNFPAPEPANGAIAQAFAEVASQADMGRLLAYQPSLGLDAHRAAAADWLNERGIPAHPDAVALTGGAQHGVLAAVAAVTRSGDVVLTEELTFYGIKSIATLLGLRLHGVAIDEHGLRADALDSACRATGAKALYCMPNLQNPTTAVMPEARRREVAEVCARHGVTVIEDDVYGFLLDAPPPALSSFAPEQSLHVTSLSKCVAPGLRIGFVRAGGETITRVGNAIKATTIMAAPFMGEVAARVIQSGEARRMADWQRAEARARQRVAHRMLGGRDMATHPAAFHLWLRLPEPWRREEFVAEARRRGVVVAGAEAFAVGRHPLPHAVRACLVAPHPRQHLERALTILAETLDDSPQRGLPVL